MHDDHHVRLIGVSKSFSTGNESLLALDDVTLDVERGEFVSIIGPSGCGKSTLLSIVGGLQEPSLGDVVVAGRTPREAQEDKSLGYIFQEPSLMPWRTARENINLPLQVNRAVNPASPVRVDELLGLVGLERFGNYYPSQLSGGMQQRVALARALVFDPTLLLMDEPFGALDEITRSRMRYELMRIWDVNKKTVIFVTHSVTEAVTLSDRVVVMSDGPGRVVGEVAIEVARPRTDALERGRVFMDHTETLRRMLTEEGRHE